MGGEGVSVAPHGLHDEQNANEAHGLLFQGHGTAENGEAQHQQDGGPGQIPVVLFQLHFAEEAYQLPDAHQDNYNANEPCNGDSQGAGIAYQHQTQHTGEGGLDPGTDIKGIFHHKTLLNWKYLRLFYSVFCPVSMEE